MKFSTCALVVCALLPFLFQESVGADEKKEGEVEAGDKAKQDQLALFAVLRNLALPRKDDPNMSISERFIMLLPGVVLDYYDYCPLEKLTPSEKDLIVPMSTRLPADENTFRLTDRVPDLNPLEGGLTGKSLSAIYRRVLYTMDTSAPSDFNVLNTTEYTKAMEFLQEPVPDPKAPDKPKLPRFELYHRYQMEYYDTVARVKTWLHTNRTEIGRENRDYENWYHNNYQTLSAHMSAAYSQWLILGQKSQVEERIAMVDIHTPRTEIEEARRALQQEELPSMDGGTVYYPVHLDPGNWYEYLRTRLVVGRFFKVTLI